MAVRSGELSDIFLTRYRKSDFPDTITDVHYGYDLGFRADLSKWTDVVCEVRGSRILVWVNGAKFPQADFRDWAPLDGGKIALGGGWETAQFKDIQIEPLDQDEPFNVYGSQTRKFTFGKTAHTVFDERIGPHREKQEYLFPEYVSIYDSTHPLVNGFGSHDLKWWNGNGGRPEVCQYVYTVLDEGNDDAEVPVQYIEPHGTGGWAARFRTPFVAFPYGKGRVIVSEFNVQVSDTDPIARRTLANIIHYAGMPVK